MLKYSDVNLDDADRRDVIIGAFWVAYGLCDLQ